MKFKLLLSIITFLIHNLFYCGITPTEQALQSLEKIWNNECKIKEIKQTHESYLHSIGQKLPTMKIWQVPYAFLLTAYSISHSSAQTQYAQQLIWTEQRKFPKTLGALTEDEKKSLTDEIVKLPSQKSCRLVAIFKPYSSDSSNKVITQFLKNYCQNNQNS